jgi:diketogulonate reductase-like aldo/keto reductase
MAERLVIPEIIYGTAFKLDKTAHLVEAALRAGFRGIDTAGSSHAYREGLVGEGIAAAMASGEFSRGDLYVSCYAIFA